MTRVAAGDAVAMRTLFDRHAPLMLGIANRLLHDRQEAEDLVNEVFLEVWHKADQFTESRGSVRTYLLLLTRSRAVDRIRSMNRQSAGGDHTIQALQGQHVADQNQGPVDSAEQKELGDVVRGVLADLTERQRSLIEMSFFDGMTHQQIAKHTDTPLGTVKGRLRRTMMVLRDRLAARLGGEQPRTSETNPADDDKSEASGGGA